MLKWLILCIFSRLLKQKFPYIHGKLYNEFPTPRAVHLIPGDPRGYARYTHTITEDSNVPRISCNDVNLKLNLNTVFTNFHTYLLKQSLKCKIRWCFCKIILEIIKCILEPKNPQVKEHSIRDYKTEIFMRSTKIKEIVHADIFALLLTKIIQNEYADEAFSKLHDFAEYDVTGGTLETK